MPIAFFPRVASLDIEGYRNVIPFGKNIIEHYFSRCEWISERNGNRESVFIFSSRKTFLLATNVMKRKPGTEIGFYWRGGKKKGGKKREPTRSIIPTEAASEGEERGGEGKRGRLKGKQASQCLMEASRRPLLLLLSPRLRGDVGGSRGCRWRRWTRHLSFTLPPAGEHVLHLSASYLSAHCHSWWRHLGNSHSPFLLSSSLSLSLSLFALLRRPSRTLSRYIHLSVPVCLLLSPLRGLSLTWNNSPSFFLYLSLSPSLLLLGLLFVSLVFRLHSILASSPRHGPPHGTPLRLAGYGNNRFPCVLSCVPGIVGNYSAQPGDPLFSVPSLQVLPATLPSLYTSLFVSSTLLFPRLVDIDKTSARWMERDRLEVTPRDEYLYRSTI